MNRDTNVLDNYACFAHSTRMQLTRKRIVDRHTMSITMGVADWELLERIRVHVGERSLSAAMRWLVATFAGSVLAEQFGQEDSQRGAVG